MSRSQTSLTETQVEDIEKVLRTGAGYQRAVMMIAGVSKATAYRWRKIGNDDLDEGIDSPESRLARAATIALATRVAKAENLIHRAVDGPTVCSKCAGASLAEKDRMHNARWVLSKLAREDYGDEISIRVQGAVEDLLEAVEPHVTRETYVSLLAAISTVSGLDTCPADEAGATEHTTH